MRRAVDQPHFVIGWQNTKWLTDLDFADDIAVNCRKRASMLRDDKLTTQLAYHGELVGLHISREKSKIIKD